MPCTLLKTKLDRGSQRRCECHMIVTIWGVMALPLHRQKVINTVNKTVSRKRRLIQMSQLLTHRRLKSKVITSRENRQNAFAHERSRLCLDQWAIGSARPWNIIHIGWLWENLCTKIKSGNTLSSRRQDYRRKKAQIFDYVGPKSIMKFLHALKMACANNGIHEKLICSCSRILWGSWKPQH